MRNVQPALLKEITAIRSIVKTSTDIATIVHVVNNYRSQKRMIESLETDIYRMNNQHNVTVRTMQREIEKHKLQIKNNAAAFVKVEKLLKTILESTGKIKKEYGTILKRR